MDPYFDVIKGQLTIEESEEKEGKEEEEEVKDTAINFEEKSPEMQSEHSDDDLED